MVFLVVVVGVAGGLAWAYSATMTGGAGARPGARSRVPDRPAGQDPKPRKIKVLPHIPVTGSRVFVRASGTSHKVGRGRLMHYAVEVEGGIGQGPNAFAETVDAILANRRGWTAAGKWAFQRVSSGPADFVVRLASPSTVDRICGSHGLDTDGLVNCAGGSDVVINLKRWVLLTPFYKGRPNLYHALAINHEVGHRLGFGHMSCPVKGGLAPVMQQQIFGLRGCKVNGWPYDSRGRFISGPATR